MKNQIKSLFFIVFMTFPVTAVDIDFSSGGYNVKKEEIKDKIKYEKRTSDEIETERQKIKEEKNKAEAEKIIEKQPWRKILFENKKVVNGDYVNETSNSVVIAVLDRERMKKDGVKNSEANRKNYCLNLLLLPGDKYHVANSESNGFRLATYEWAHKKREQLIKEHELNYIMNFDKDKDGLSFYEELCGTNILLKLEEGDKEIWAITDINTKDTDRDGLSDFEEIKGIKGFVTDPLDPDTDKDGIPDGVDRNPLIKCKSSDPSLMPQEWIEYLSKGDPEKANLLRLAKGDPDGDGITNEQEMIFSTDPLEAEQEKAIVYPKQLLLRYNGKGAYNCIINVYFNRDEPANCLLWTDSDGFGNRMNIENLKIKHLSSSPLGWKPSSLKTIFSQYKFKTKYMAAKIEPKTIHTFKIIYEPNDTSHLYYEHIHVSLCDLGTNPDDRDGFMYPFFKTNVRIDQNYFNPGISSINNKNYYPKPPELLYPPDDFIYETFTNNFFVYQDISEKYKNMKWQCSLKILPSRILKPNDGGIGFKNLYSLPNNKKEAIAKINDFNKNTCLWFLALTDPVFNHCMVYSDIRIMFKKDKITEDHPLVFKGNTEEEILKEIEKRYKGTVIK